MVVAAGLTLVIPVSFLLFLQWPLRELVQAYSREANDIAQALFAVYVSLAITYATRHGTHLAADALAHRYSARLRNRLQRVGCLLVLVPWSLFTLYAASPAVWQSLLLREAFPETFNPGYFVIKVALWLLPALVCLQAIIDALIARDAH